MATKTTIYLSLGYFRLHFKASTATAGFAEGEARLHWREHCPLQHPLYSVYFAIIPSEAAKINHLSSYLYFKERCRNLEPGGNSLPLENASVSSQQFVRTVNAESQIGVVFCISSVGLHPLSYIRRYCVFIGGTTIWRSPAPGAEGREEDVPPGKWMSVGGASGAVFKKSSGGQQLRRVHPK